MNKHLPTILGKGISVVSKISGQGNGSTWPGHIALQLNPRYIRDLLKDAPTKIILVVGTNGKTTTTKILSTLLEENGYKVFENTSGANLLNGIASSFLLHTNMQGKLTADFAIFEVDENNLPLILKEITPVAIVALDLFRDQLDRYGELDSIAAKWQKSFSSLPTSVSLILNADDPLIAHLGQNTNAPVMYFGLTTGKKQNLSHAADTIYCPRCNSKLRFFKVSYSHLGEWECLHCRLKRPSPTLSESYYPLSGIYNQYNTLAAVTTALTLGLDPQSIDMALHTVVAAFGRQEILEYRGKKIQIFLAKNPTGSNEALRTAAELGAKHVLFLLNDRIPDGRDVSWIWDIDIEQFAHSFDHVTVSGDRTYDMALRMQYADTHVPFHAEPSVKNALLYALNKTPSSQMLFVMPTYSAMLDLRKIITGRSIL